MNKTLNYNGSKFYKINLAFVNKNKRFSYDYYISLGQKLIQYTRKENNNQKEIKKLLNRNIDFIYLKETEYKRYVHDSIEESNKPNKKNNTSVSNTLEDFINNKEYISEFFISCGLDEIKIKMLKKNNECVKNILKKEKRLFNIYNNFYRNIDDVYKVKKDILILTNINILSYARNVTSDHILKATTAITLEDLLLNKDDINTSYSNNIRNLSDKIKNHSVEILDYLPKHKEFQSDIIYNLLKYHHEKPDGSGYPFKIKHYHYDLFMAVRYLSEYYVNLLIEKEFKLNEISAIIEQVNNEAKKYKTNSFKKALDLFNKAFLKEEIIG